MNDFNPFLNLVEKNDEDLMNDLTRIYSMLSHYNQMGNGALVSQLQIYRDTYINELQNRAEKKSADKDNKNKVIIDTSDEANEKLNKMNKIKKSDI